MVITKDSNVEELFAIREPVAAPVIHWAVELYGFGKHLRQYGFYPKKWSLFVFSEHSGPAISLPYTKYEEDNATTCILFHSPYSVKKWREKHRLPCYGLYSPFVYYRKKHNITQSPSAKGTLAYPGHSIPDVHIISPVEDYINQLKALPEEFQPVSISMHIEDVKKGMHLPYLEHGMQVFTAGHPADYQFTEEFYKVLRNFKFATSNYLGSYLFYVVEMGIPFFLYGSKPIFEKDSDSDIANIAFDSVVVNVERTQWLTDEFSPMVTEVTPAQKALVEKELGLLDHNSRIKLAFILYKYYLKSLPERFKNLFKRTFNRA